MSNKIIAVVLAVVVVLGGWYFFMREGSVSGVSANQAEYFQDTLTARAIQNMNGMMPIEGFDADLLLGAMGGLEPGDFRDVEALEGKYEVEGDAVEFVRSGEQPMSSAERMVTLEGYGTLLENVSERLDMPAETNSDVDAIVDALDTDTDEAGTGTSTGTDTDAGNDNGGDDEAVFCTMDAMQCPDGSYVGRTGPNCEFVCPGE